MATKESLGDLLLCPICFIQFVGRVFQCLRGHTVCEKCLPQLDACPVCREVFSGTRNFLLEDLILKLTNLPVRGIPSSIEANLTTSVTEATVQEVLDDSSASSSSDGGSTVNSVEELPINMAEPLPFIGFDLNDIIGYEIPKQTNGFFKCHMLNCDAQLPICRIYNHLRTYHKEMYTEFKTPPDSPQDDAIFNFTVASNQEYRRAIHIPNFGLFFVIYNTIRQDDYIFIMAWVQCVSKNNYARQFRFCMDLRMFYRDITYSDFVHGQQTDQQAIVHQKKCLYFRLKVSTYAGNSASSNGELTVKIGRHINDPSAPRPATTTVRMLPRPRNRVQAAQVVSAPAVPAPAIPPPAPSQQQPQGARPANGRPSRRQRGRNVFRRV